MTEKTKKLKKTMGRVNELPAKIKPLQIVGDMRAYNLTNEDLTNKDFSDVNLRSAYLDKANFKNANLSKADLKGARLIGANLANANLRGADLRGATLKDSNLSGADLKGAIYSVMTVFPSNFSLSANMVKKEVEWYNAD